MTVTVANTANSDTIFAGRTRMNELAHAMTNKVVTVDSNTATGNAAVTGALQSNAVHTTTIMGGTVTVPANLSITTNANFSAKVNLGAGANVIVTTGNSTHRVLTVNSSNSFTLVATKISLSDVSDANVTTPANNDVFIYSEAESAFKNSPATVLTVGNAANAVYAANADKLDGFDSSYFANNTHAHDYSTLTNKPTTAAGFGLAEINLGNSTVNSVSTNTSVTVSDTTGNVAVISTRVAAANSTGNAAITPAGLAVGNSSSTITVVNTTVVSVSGTVVANTSAVLVGNSTVNAVVTATSVTLANSTVSVAFTKPDASQVSSGNYFMGSNGTWQQVATGTPAMTTFTANGTWTKQAGLKSIKVTVVGGGGGTATSPTGTFGGAGGGGAAIKFIPAPSIPGPQPVTVGLGGPSTAPSAGGTSSFGALVSATGGAQANTNWPGPGKASGGTGSSGDVNVTGGWGTMGSHPSGASADLYTGLGGSSILGQGGYDTGLTPSAPVPVTAPNLASVSGTGYGAGASGKKGPGGAAGTNGIIIVEEFY